MGRTPVFRSMLAVMAAAVVLAACGGAGVEPAEAGAGQTEAGAEPAEAEFPEGVYQMEISTEALEEGDVTAADAYNHAGTWTLTFKDGQLVVEDVTEAHGQLVGEGVYCVEGDRVSLGVLGDPPTCGDFWSAGWSLEGDQLRFVDVESGHGSDQLIEVLFGSQPFTRIGEAATQGATRTLRMAHIDGGPSGDPAVNWFTEEVDGISDGALSIDVVRECCGGEPDVEERLVAAVAGGEFDLGWVGTRVFAGLGAHDFAGLTAPLLLDSYALQQAVLSSDIPEEMLGGVDGLGVEGVAVVPGFLRRPIAAERPLLAPADWQGQTIHAFHSVDNATVVAALGATPTDVGFEERDAGLEDGSIHGLENSVTFHVDFASVAPYLTLNVPLWPRTSTLVINPDMADELDDAQHGWLREAAAAVVARTGEMADRDAELMEIACDSGGRYALASETDLAALREAVSPVYDELEQDPATKSSIEQIRELAEATTAEELPAIPDGCGPDTPPVPAVDQ